MPRVAIVACVCALVWADAGCARKRAVVEPSGARVTVAKSYPGRAAEKMREAIGKLRRRPAPRAAAAAQAPPPPDERTVGTTGNASPAGEPGAASSMGRETTSQPPPRPSSPPASEEDTTAHAPFDPLLVVIVAGWIALLVLLPILIRQAWRRRARS